MGQAAGSQEEDGIQQPEPLGGAFACRSQGIRQSGLASVATDRLDREEEEGTSVWEPDTRRGRMKGARIWEGPEWLCGRAVGGRSSRQHLSGRGFGGAKWMVGTTVPRGLMAGHSFLIFLSLQEPK